MKFKLLVLGATFALAGCMQGPQSTEEVRNATAGNGGFNSLFAQRSTVSIPRSYSAVTSSLRTGASKCFNRTVRSVSTTPGPYGPQTQVIIVDYSSTFRSNGRRTEMALKQQVRGGIFKQPGGFSYLVDAAPKGSGTQLTIHGGKFGYKKLNTAVEQWARGGSIICPKLPGS